jgi:exodeoxyribonuclease VII large subunit
VFHHLQEGGHRLSLQATSLDNLSPLKTLSRGYAAITMNDSVISSVKQLKSNDEVTIRLKDGEKNARVL